MSNNDTKPEEGDDCEAEFLKELMETVAEDEPDRPPVATNPDFGYSEYELAEQFKWRQIIEYVQDYQEQIEDSRKYLDELEARCQVASMHLESLEQIYSALRLVQTLLRKHCVA